MQQCATTTAYIHAFAGRAIWCITYSLHAARFGHCSHAGYLCRRCYMVAVVQVDAVATGVATASYLKRLLPLLGQLPARGNGTEPMQVGPHRR